MKRILYMTGAILLLFLLTGCFNNSSKESNKQTALEPGVAGDDMLTTKLEYIRKQNNLPALAAITLHGKNIVEMAATGQRKFGQAQQVTLNDHWHIGSISKPMTSTLAAILVEQGAISWDTTIADVFPDLVDIMETQYKAVTLEELLSHRSGINDDDIDESFLYSFYENSAPITVQRRQAVEVILTKAPGQPRGSFMYSNAGYVIAGAMLEAVTGESWEYLMQSRLFSPLGMNSSGFGAPGTAGSSNEPWGHEPSEKGWTAIDPGNPDADNPAVIGPAGTINSTMSDIALFMAAHLAGAHGASGLVSQESFQKLHTPFGENQYALGWIVANNQLIHNGSNTLWYAIIIIDPNSDVAFFCATNAYNSQTEQVIIEKLIPVLVERFEAAFSSTDIK